VTLKADWADAGADSPAKAEAASVTATTIFLFILGSFPVVPCRLGLEPVRRLCFPALHTMNGHVGKRSGNASLVYPFSSGALWSLSILLPRRMTWFKLFGIEAAFDMCVTPLPEGSQA
jgi:hypothetical protein